MIFRSRVFETRVYTSSTTPASPSCTPQASGFFDDLGLEACYEDVLLSKKGLISSIGIGKMMVEFFSVAISASVCR